MLINGVIPSKYVVVDAGNSLTGQYSLNANSNRKFPFPVNNRKFHKSILCANYRC